MPPNENLLVIPDDWRAALHPRRGGTPGPSLELDADAVSVVQQWVKETRDEIDHLLDKAQSRRDLVGSARAYLQGEANPQGAAVIAAVLAAEWPLRDDYEYGEDPFATFADAWIAEHGLVFAAVATVELSGVFVDGYDWRERTDRRHLRLRRLDKQDPGYNMGLECLGLVAARVRGFLAAADEPEYERAIDALGERRHDGMRRLAVAYLVPTQTAWVDELCAALPELQPDTWMMALRTMGSADQLATLLAGQSGWYWLNVPGVLSTAVEGVGPALASTLATVAEEETEIGRNPYELLRALGVLATDEAFRLLVDRLDRPHVHKAVIETARHHPRRALRLLSEAAASGPAPISSYAVRLLRDHVAARPDITAAVLPRLSAEAREVVESIGESAAGWAPEAAAESLPRLLVEPPWTRERPEFKRVTVKGLEPLTAGVPGEPEGRAEIRALIPIALGKTGPQRSRRRPPLGASPRPKATRQRESLKWPVSTVPRLRKPPRRCSPPTPWTTFRPRCRGGRSGRIRTSSPKCSFGRTASHFPPTRSTTSSPCSPSPSRTSRMQASTSSGRSALPPPSPHSPGGCSRRRACASRATPQRTPTGC
jgi:hypothetical protein